ncbi:integrase [Peribacillus butanolivorans]|uniref:Integrase n=1 Tax=Peribacillus butanolivorans TaxID=421767 RepID=A0AAX0RRS5_9BACI|nr:tyrosine-type recombinase/integrase [Peribacillus butanolivorans]KON69614.1 hypothetical protein AKG34_13225 [Peribacillus butanolivorans]PEJ32314.1 integrase [Peribacillus butanolivorans]
MKRTRFLTKDEQQKLNTVDKKVNYVTDWTSAMEMFLKDCEIRGLREATSFYYVKETRMIFRYWEEQELDISPDQLTSEHITDLILYMKNKKELSPSSINIRLRAFKTVLKWLYDNKKVPINAGDGVKRLKFRRAAIEAFSVEQLRRFFNEIENNTWIGVRDTAICLVLLECGLRQNEILNLNVFDVVFEQNYIMVRHTKTYHMRKVPITDRTKNAIRRWLTVRGESKYSQLFINISGNQLTNRGLYQLIEKYGKRAKIEGIRCSPHTFRHTCAKLYLKNGGDLFSLQAILGHMNIEQTKRYVTLNHDDVADLHAEHSPLNAVWKK